MIEFLWLTIAITIPLILNPWGHNVFELPKALLLQALVTVLALAFLIQHFEKRALPNQAQTRRLSPLVVWPTVAFGISLILATLSSANPNSSLWGSYERKQGLITHGSYLALFLLTATNLRTRAQVERLWRALVWGSAPIVGYGLIQAAGLDPLTWRVDTAAPILSTIGRSNFLGSYLVLILPLTLGRMLLASRRWPYLLLAAGQLACLLLTQAQSAWVGAFALLIVFGLILSVIHRNRRRTVAIIVIAVLVSGFVILLNQPGSILSPLTVLPGFDRLSTLTRIDSGSTAARLTIWQATFPLIAESPWLGHGPETMRTVFARGFPPQLVYYQGRDIAIDRAHNLWLDLGMSAGLTGIITFALLIALWGWLALRGLRSTACRWEQIAWMSLMAAAIGHLVDLQFSFDVTATATAFWLILAVGAALARGLDNQPEHTAQSLPQTLHFLPYLPPTLVTLALISMINIRPMLADAAYQRSQIGSLPVMQRIEAGAQAVSLWPLEREYYLGLSRGFLESGRFPEAEAQLAAADQLSPNDPQVWAAKGEVYAYWGDIERVRVYGEAGLTIETDTAPDRFVQAEAAYRRALELAPNIATYHAELGAVLARQGRLSEGLLELERATALDATNSVALGRLGILYLTTGQLTKAEMAFAKARQNK